MTIKLTAIGKTDDAQLKSLIDLYYKRLQHYNRFELQIIPDLKKVKNLSEQQQKEKEGTLILKQVSTADLLILLDENGIQYTSIAFSKFLQKQMNSGRKVIHFVIGGPYGFSDEVYQRADQKIGLSKMTFSHQMIRLFFTEQLYRAFTILKNEPYHHQ